METKIVKDITVSISDCSLIELYLRINGYRNFSIHCHTPTTATIVFEREEDLLTVLLKGIIEKSRINETFYNLGPHFDFMVRLEKKLNSYNKHDEYFIRKVVK